MSMPETFYLRDVYRYERELEREFPNNYNVQAKIRQQLQFLRDDDIIEFVDNDGTYRRLSI